MNAGPILKIASENLFPILSIVIVLYGIYAGKTRPDKVLRKTQNGKTYNYVIVGGVVLLAFWLMVQFLH